MAFILKKMRCKTIRPDCVKPSIILPRSVKVKKIASESRMDVSRLQISLQRLSVSDFSNSSSLISLNDLSSSLVGSNLHFFTLQELQVMTNNFSRDELLGRGGFGKVYKGFIDDRLKPGLKAQPVAVKVLDLNGSQGHDEWLAEVIFLGQLKHPHLVKLIGCCCEDEHRLLVYEYMPLGNLENKLFENYYAPLPWLTRIKIAIGTAECLAFLHGEAKPVICRDLKSSNILLDKDYVAKLSDFGLAKDGPQGDDTHISTRVMGTEGYAAPEYLQTGHLTTMCDVYSFGVVLLELLTGKKIVDRNRPRKERYLVEWARPMLKDFNKLEQILDPRLEGQPTMSNVVKTLEPLLDLNDIPRGPFVFIVSPEGNTSFVLNNSDEKGEEKEEKKDDKRQPSVTKGSTTTASD
ncbi:hypothetical protein Patl1_33702 [Pistacia atlantica]|uniref:Uncharacterized protein n=1 Tax=Pistacia atlantica TaxID=434234 RepID=A0ACC0ZRW2_9ROSI|nr:hypothetical protein Patl1_33702 [Pistacia atlantica]